MASTTDEQEIACEVDISDIDYLDVAGQRLQARLFQPRGEGPFPAVVDLHGGAWTEGDRHGNDAINLPLARHGVVVLSIDYRVPPQGTYPASVQDANFAVRWLKAHAERFRTAPDRVGIIGTSSGGHLALLAAMKPRDPRFAALPLASEVDAAVAFVVAMWPVVCPYGRFQDVVVNRVGEPPADRAGAGRKQMDYWLTEEAMQDGSPALALARHDEVELPHVLYVQNPTDQIHPFESARQFAQAYRDRGGELAMHLVHGAAYNLVRIEHASEQAREAVACMARFIHDRSDAAAA